MPQIVIEIPEELKSVAEAVEKLVAVVVATKTAASGGGQVDYDAVEVAVGGAAAAVEAKCHEVILASLDRDVPFVLVEGIRYARVGRHLATYYTLAGAVEVMRGIYRRCGERNGRTVDMVSLRAGVVGEGWLPRTARVLAHEVQQRPSREVAASMVELGRARYSRSSIEDVAHAVGAHVVARHVEVEEALAREFEVKAAARSVTVSLDRVSVPMEEPRRRPVGRPRKGAPQRPVTRTFRMAYCGTVTLHDAEGRALHTIRYGAMPNGDAKQLCLGLVSDVEALLAKRPDLRVGLLCDGAPEMWNLLDAEFNDPPCAVEVYRLVDLWHLLEKLGHAAAVLNPSPEQAKGQVSRWRLALLNRSTAAAEILAELHASGKEHTKVGSETPVHDAITYLTNHADRMDYATARRRGLAVGSGNVEATCKSLFEVRMKRAGSRWKDESGEHIVHLRALALSDRWARAIELTLAPLRKSVAFAA